jgi:hypothetical protein
MPVPEYSQIHRQNFNDRSHASKMKNLIGGYNFSLKDT